jgi:flagellar M-ring protein FliF
MSFAMTTGDTLKQANRRQIILIAGAALAGTALLFALWYLVVRVPYVPAFSGLKSTEAVSIVGELDRLKTPYRLADDGATVLVPSDKVDATRVKILGGDLPIKGAVGFELFNKTDMGLSEFAQKINYQRALQGELARTIMALDEVDTARVHLSLPESGIFQRDRQRAKASITITTKAGAIVDDDAVSGIQHLVASAVSDLQAENVAILDARGRLLNSVAPTDQAPQDERRSALEQVYAGTLRSAIAASGLTMPMTIDVISFENSVSSPMSVSNTGRSTPLGARKWPLKISIGLTAEPGPLVRERLLTAARQAVEFDSALGDVIAIEINAVRPAPLSGRLPVPSPVPAALPSSAPDATVPAHLFWLIIAGVLLVLLGLFAWRSWEKRAVIWSPNEREAFAARLKALLEEDARHAQRST